MDTALEVFSVWGVGTRYMSEWSRTRRCTCPLDLENRDKRYTRSRTRCTCPPWGRSRDRASLCRAERSADRAIVPRSRFVSLRYGIIINSLIHSNNITLDLTVDEHRLKALYNEGCTAHGPKPAAGPYHGKKARLHAAAAAHVSSMHRRASASS